MEWTEAHTFITYYNMQRNRDKKVMPKFILLSAHGETMLPILQNFSEFFDFNTLDPNPASMFLVNFFECQSCDYEDKFSVEISYYPHNSDQDDYED